MDDRLLPGPGGGTAGPERLAPIPSLVLSLSISVHSEGKTVNQPVQQACRSCGLIQQVPALEPGSRVACARCGRGLSRVRDGRRAANRCAAAALGALVLYWPAILLPFMEVEQLGHHHTASILSGTLDLVRSGSWFIGLVIFLFSVVLPLVKILLLLELSLFGLLGQRHRALSFRLVEQVGKWGMLDVMVLALLVMLIKLGSLVTFHIGPAVFAFTACVIMSLIASMLFDPLSIWEKSE